MQKIENLDKKELETLLKNLKLYKDLVKKVGERGKHIYENKFNGKNDYIVEYYGNLEKSYVLEKAKKVYKKVFEIDVSDTEVIINKNNNIRGGIKVYLNDSLVDLSFLKFYNLLK